VLFKIELPVGKLGCLFGMGTLATQQRHHRITDLPGPRPSRHPRRYRCLRPRVTDPSTA
jgi:hypothetical protein